jgi:hypothetical protein
MALSLVFILVVLAVFLPLAFGMVFVFVTLLNKQQNRDRPQKKDEILDVVDVETED